MQALFLGLSGYNSTLQTYFCALYQGKILAAPFESSRD